MKKGIFDPDCFTIDLVTQEWFEENSVGDPVEASEKWGNWLSENPNRISNSRALLKKVLEVTTGKSEAAIRNYLHRDSSRNAKNSEQTSRVLDAITLSLGIIPPNRKKTPIFNKKNKIALLTELSSLPSQHYHLEVIHGIISQAKEYKYSVSLYEIQNDNFEKTVKSIILSYRPDGIIIVRRAPNEDSIAYLENEEIPIVLINSDDRDYSFPIISNIIPIANKKLEENFRQWVLNIPALNKSREVVIAAMNAEDSHRIDRINFISKVLIEENFIPVRYNVKSYLFTEALALLKEHRNALAYICLSDQIAIGLKHLLITDNQLFENRIIGFDDSRQAEVEQITSFGQQLSEIGGLAIVKLNEYFKNPSSSQSFNRAKVDMYLSRRL